MRVNDATKLLALSFTSELVKRRKKRKSEDPSSYNDDVPDDVDANERSFGELENDYRKVLKALEESPDIRESIVDTLKSFQDAGMDLNDFYPSTDIAQSKSLRKVLFVDDEKN